MTISWCGGRARSHWPRLWLVRLLLQAVMEAVTGSDHAVPTGHPLCQPVVRHPPLSNH